MKYKSVNIFFSDRDLNPNTQTTATQTEKDGKWVMARPIGYIGLLHRIKCAWEVFQGRADIIKWHKQ